MGSGSSSTETKFTKTDPWGPAQPSLIKSLGAANDAFDNTYNGSSVTPLDPLVQQSQNQMVNNANSGQLSGMANTAAGTIGGILQNGGLTQEQQNAITGLNGTLSGFNAQSAQNLGNLNPIANGSMIGHNPYLDKSIQDSMNDAAAATNRQFSAAGRYGSGAQTSVLGDRLGKIANDARMGAYETDSNRQLQALGMANTANNDSMSGNLSGQAALSQLGQQRLANTEGIVGAMPGLQQAQNIDASSLGNVGGARMDYNQKVIDAANADPWTKAQNLSQIAQGIGSMGGTSFSIGKKENDPGVMGTIGSALSGAGAVGNLFSAPAGGTSAAAGFAALFSDERLKENIEPVGKLDDGQKIYAYNYKGDGTPQIGLLAQEVEKFVPDAVRTDPGSGMKMVDYRRATRNAREKKAA